MCYIIGSLYTTTVHGIVPLKAKEGEYDLYYPQTVMILILQLNTTRRASGSVLWYSSWPIHHFSKNVQLTATRIYEIYEVPDYQIKICFSVQLSPDPSPPPIDPSGQGQILPDGHILIPLHMGLLPKVQQRMGGFRGLFLIQLSLEIVHILVEQERR